MTTDLLHRVLDHAGSHPGHLAVKDLEKSLSYAELVESAARLAAGLRARGVSEGDRVALYLPNSTDFVVAAFASLWIGAIFVPLAVSDPPRRLATIVEDCAPAIIVGVGDASGCPASDSVGGVPVTGIHALEEAAAPTFPAPPASSRPAYAIYTSGTTGTPKGVLINNPAFLAAVRSIATALGLTRSCRTLCVSPFHFDGSFGTLFSTLFAGGTAIIWPRDSLVFPRTFFAALDAESVTCTAFSPSYLRLLLASPQFASLGRSSLEVLSLGGEACSIADIRALWAVAPQLRVFNRYGPTETTIAVSNQELTPELTAAGIVPLGTPNPGVSFHLVDENGDLVTKANCVGELYIGGTQLMNRYWGAPELTDSVLRTDIVNGETLYRSGDLVYRNERGLYVYVDRADRVIKRSGVRISLVELSEVIRSLDGVSAAACVAFDDDGGLGIAAFVVVEESMTIRALQLAVRDVLPEAMLPNRIEILESFPLAHSSKIDEQALLTSVGIRPLQAAPLMESTVRAISRI